MKIHVPIFALCLFLVACSKSSPLSTSMTVQFVFNIKGTGGYNYKYKIFQAPPNEGQEVYGTATGSMTKTFTLTGTKNGLHTQFSNNITSLNTADTVQALIYINGALWNNPWTTGYSYDNGEYDW